MLNKFVLVILTLQLARAERHAAAQSGPRGPATGSADGCNLSNCKACVTGDNTKCSKCQDTHVPIDGACDTIANANAKCTPPSTADGTCKSCLGSYYLYSGGCYAACPQGTHKNEGQHTCDKDVTPDCNLSNCEVCSEDKKTCSKCKQGFTLSGDKTQCEPSSTNKSSLSTGAIAGISVAAVVVVGGLVGFLCWWFLCRGKA